ncbi:alpha/beta hydrolase [Leptobacterium flavescens]|uniref:Alpha/beta hydrolase n=1 Tax=Leptobacterium flavescens TaxID=472055 RepID=A0A6P0ULR7_9FLAO|nr:alpha/beta hydrolase [Leptobacterium flavescens]NER11993.1 alpha/beta hydrolase [Leptobacterium flavescens]
MGKEKIHVYFMPGMAANPSIFENISLPEESYEIHLLEWIIPEKAESIQNYAKRMTARIKHPSPVLIGVSFGGILVQEMAKHIEVRKLIIISSVKSNKELPKRMIFAKYTKVHKLLPTGLVNNVELLAKYAFGETVTKRLSLYEKYLSVRNKYYIDWSIDQIVNWKQSSPPENIVHIHGEKDAVFPSVYIDDYVGLKEGTHIMIINKYKWFNENLPKIILS